VKNQHPIWSKSVGQNLPPNSSAFLRPPKQYPRRIAGASTHAERAGGNHCLANVSGQYDSRFVIIERLTTQFDAARLSSDTYICAPFGLFDPESSWPPSSPGAILIFVKSPLQPIPSINPNPAEGGWDVRAGDLYPIVRFDVGYTVQCSIRNQPRPMSRLFPINIVHFQSKAGGLTWEHQETTFSPVDSICENGSGGPYTQKSEWETR